MFEPRYSVGIDLGTTHIVVASYDRQTVATSDQIQLFNIPQFVAPGQVAALSKLPAFCYFPDKEAWPQDLRQLPWGETDCVIGEWAKSDGHRYPDRLIASTKSWLSHPYVNRESAILPWQSRSEKYSPVEISMRFLMHIRDAWDYEFEKYPLHEQEIILTIPASFDDAARILTLKAAKTAGLERIHLIEEPQAAFYHWLSEHEYDKVKSETPVNATALVCDIGGGTTDFTLINLNISDKTPELKRIAVGAHLLLGGDNMDLTLAYLVKSKFSKPQQISGTQFASIVNQCRQAKEILLSQVESDSINIALVGESSTLIAGSESVLLTKDDVLFTLLEGFLPKVNLDAELELAQSGLHRVSLPYAKEPAITKHLLQFLRQAAENGEVIKPDVVLLNGGVFQSERLVEQFLNVLNHWQGQPVSALVNAHPEHAVAKGAVAYDMARRGVFLKIDSGAAQHYFLVLDPKTKESVCIIPKDTAVDLAITLPNTFQLRIGEPVQFHVVTSKENLTVSPGALLHMAETSYETLPVLTTKIEHKNKASVEVQVTAKINEIGILEIACIDEVGNTYPLHFNLRETVETQDTESDMALVPVSESALMQAKGFIANVFRRKCHLSVHAIKQLHAQLESLFGKKNTWPINLLRCLAELFLAHKRYRSQSEYHEAIFWNELGFCMRPGFGYPGDEKRCLEITEFYNQSLYFPQKAQVWSEWCVALRRVSGGLSQAQHVHLYEKLKHAVYTPRSKLSQRNQFAIYEKIRLCATLEHLPIEDKIKLGETLLKQVLKQPENACYTWALARVGSRQPLYGGIDSIIPSEIIETWLTQLFEVIIKKENRGFILLLILISQKSISQALCVTEHWANKVGQLLSKLKVPVAEVKCLYHYKKMDERLLSQVVGESLPLGLSLSIA